MAQPSATRIGNRALVLLGTAQRIASLTDSSPLAQAIADVFDDCRDEVLSEHPWNFAIRRKVLTATAETVELGEWGAGFELPSDCLRWLPWAQGHELYFKAVREGRYLLAELEADAPPTIRYIALIEDVAAWSPGFREAMAGKVAMWISTAAPVQSEVSARRAESIYETALSRGRRQDALENSDNERNQESRSSWLQSRNG